MLEVPYPTLGQAVEAIKGGSGIKARNVFIISAIYPYTPGIECGEACCKAPALRFANFPPAALGLPDEPGTGWCACGFRPIPLWEEPTRVCEEIEA